MSQQDHTIQTAAGAALESATLADPMAFARDGGSLSGSVEVVRLQRLRDLLADASGCITWEVRGGEEEDELGQRGSRKFLWLDLEGELRLVCQRCLGPYVFPLRLSGCLELIAPGASWPDDELEDESCDAIEGARNLELLPLVEDEILLALPQSPRHEVCAPPDEAAGSGKTSPFAVLAGLKK
ncbi:MAG: YceD family protein [Rhodocyclaceae bacterium]|nr:YceD family protein [Rhodocyclaceae bacterium]